MNVQPEEDWNEDDAWFEYSEGENQCPVPDEIVKSCSLNEVLQATVCRGEIGGHPPTCYAREQGSGSIKYDRGEEFCGRCSFDRRRCPPLEEAKDL